MSTYFNWTTTYLPDALITTTDATALLNAIKTGFEGVESDFSGASGIAASVAAATAAKVAAQSAETGATAQAVIATTQASNAATSAGIAQGAAASALVTAASIGAAAGFPAFAGNAGKALLVNPAGNGVTFASTFSGRASRLYFSSL
jgi:hypothetical protein